jgi:fatty-acyl-CoA synthase
MRAGVLDFATTHISERAAIPKRVSIADQLPLTGVGKIFKPALQQQEIENVIRSEAEAAGVALVDVAVDRDPQAGLMARIQTSGGAKSLGGSQPKS